MKLVGALATIGFALGAGACGADVTVDRSAGAGTGGASSDASTSSSSSSSGVGGGAVSSSASSTASTASTSSAASSGSSSSGVVSSNGLTLVTEPTDGMTPIYDFIGTATKTLDMTMYELVDTQITGLLVGLAGKGVAVRVILDQNLEMKSNTAAYDALEAGGVNVHWANPVYRATHEKMIAVDGTTAAIMTLNLAKEYYPTSRDFGVITTDAADVAAIEATFAADLTNASITPANGDELVWSPTNAQSSLVDLINGAKTSLLLENEEMSDQTIIAALGSAAKRGVAVQIAMTASKSWDAAFTTLKGDGAKIVTYAPNAPLYIHAKVILADYGTSTAKVFIGSENFSNASLTENRELGMVTTNAAIMTSINATLSSDFAGGTAF